MVEDLEVQIKNSFSEKQMEILKHLNEDADVAECNLKIVYPERVELFTDKRYYQVCTKQEYLEEEC